VAEARVLVEAGDDGDREVGRGGALGGARDGGQFGRAGQDVFAEAVDTRDGSAAVDDLAAEGRVGVAGVAERRTADGLGYEVLVGAVEQGDDGAGCVEAVEAELGEGGKARVRGGRQDGGGKGLVRELFGRWAAQSRGGDPEIVIPVGERQ
jgi:hypothetical protein